MSSPDIVRSRRLHHVAYATRDPEATYEFYAKKLGMKLLRTETLEELESMTKRMHTHGIDEIVRVDHGWATSIYATDPNGITVEFCVTTDPAEFGQTEEETLRLLRQPPDEIVEDTRKEVGIARRV